MTSKKCEMVKNAIFLLKINNPPHPPPVGDSPQCSRPIMNTLDHMGVVAHVLQHYVTAISGGSPPIAGVKKGVGGNQVRGKCHV